MNETTGEAAKAVDKGGLFFRLLRNERFEGFEKSFKMADKTLLSNRYLLGIHRRDVAPEKLVDICERLGMPGKYLVAFKKNLPGASTVHFGFEESETGFIYKAYLELGGQLQQAFAANPRDSGEFGDTVLLHLAYKWDALDRDKCTVAKYDCYPRLPTEAMLKRLADIYSGLNGSISFEVVKSIIALASSRTVKSLMYLEVSEENNPRSSFDINLHAAGLRLNEVEHFLSQMHRHYSIPVEQFGRMFDQVRAEKLGHVSGGMSREGRDFLTVYHEVGSR